MSQSLVDRALRKMSAPAPAEAELPAPMVPPRPLDFRALAPQSAPPRHWFREQQIPAGTTLLSAKGGVGKTQLVQHESTAAAIGRAYIGPPCEPYKSLCWLCEDDHDELWRRQERICGHEQIPMAELDGKLHIVSRYGCENALMTHVHGALVTTSVLTELREQVNDLQIDVLWLDNAAHVFLGDHDNRTEVTAFVNALNGLVRGRPFAVVIVAHVSRGQGSEFSGSVAWENAARTRLYLGDTLPDQKRDPDEEADEDVRFLCRRKANYSSRDYMRFRMVDGLLIPETAPGHVSSVVAAVDRERAEQVCIGGLRKLAAMGIAATDGKTSPDYLPTQLLAKGLADGFTKKDLVGAMNRLMTAGRLERGQVGHYANRTPRFGLIEKGVR